MTQAKRPAGKYRACYVAFLDVLGFSALVDRSTRDRLIVNEIAAITTAFTHPRGNIKELKGGTLPIQVRAFSDSFVAFTPVDHSGLPPDRHPLTELCFVLRHLHDKVLSLGHCVRGAITVGDMFWAHSWDRTPDTRTLLITFGPGLIDAYNLEHDLAKYPRIILSDSANDMAQDDCVPARPFAQNKRDDARLKDYIVDTDLLGTGDNTPFIDILHPDVIRSTEERLENRRNNFSIFVPGGAPSSHSAVIEQCFAIASNHKDPETSETSTPSQTRTSIADKYTWLHDYAGSHYSRSLDY